MEDLLNAALKSIREMSPEQLKEELAKHKNSDVAVIIRELNSPQACDKEFQIPKNTGLPSVLNDKSNITGFISFSSSARRHFVLQLCSRYGVKKEVIESLFDPETNGYTDPAINAMWAGYLLNTVTKADYVLTVDGDDGKPKFSDSPVRHESLMRARKESKRLVRKTGKNVSVWQLSHRAVPKTRKSKDAE